MRKTTRAWARKLIEWIAGQVMGKNIRSWERRLWYGDLGLKTKGIIGRLGKGIRLLCEKGTIGMGKKTRPRARKLSEWIAGWGMGKRL